MKTKYKYIHFVQNREKWGVYNIKSGAWLGNIVLDDDPNAFNDDFKFWHDLGFALFLECRYKEAIKFYKKSLDINEMTIDVWCDLGEAYEKINNFKQAISCYNKVYELDQVKGEGLKNQIIKGQILNEFSGNVKIGGEKIR